MFGEEEPLTVNELYDNLLLETLPSVFILLDPHPKLASFKLETTEGRVLDIKACLEIQEDLTFRNAFKIVTKVINIAAHLGSKSS
uniref:Uncharacterized protein n=1 Tax=Lepeophtheirus salmonis TaxID=72036 RepID=A0A0K2UEF3_LEPSM